MLLPHAATLVFYTLYVRQTVAALNQAKVRIAACCDVFCSAMSANANSVHPATSQACVYVTPPVGCCFPHSQKLNTPSSLFVTFFVCCCCGFNHPYAISRSRKKHPSLLTFSSVCSVPSTQYNNNSKNNNNNNVHLACAHQRPERSHDTY